MFLPTQKHEEPEIAKTTDLDALAAELMKLPKEERARLLAKLLGEVEGDTGTAGAAQRA